MPASVRLAVLTDAAALAELRWLSRETSERAKEAVAAFEPTFRQWFQRALSSNTWRVAVAKGETSSLVGCMYLNRVEKVPVPGQTERSWGYITNAYVRDGSRGNGTGKALLGLLVAVAREWRLEFVVVWPSTEAVSFYKRAGFMSAEEQLTANPSDEPVLLLHLSDFVPERA
jgi:ribosomal protein S18 acetylase RimI-like enzyme